MKRNDESISGRWKISIIRLPVGRLVRPLQWQTLSIRPNGVGISFLPRTDAFRCPALLEKRGDGIHRPSHVASTTERACSFRARRYPAPLPVSVWKLHPRGSL